MCSASSKIDEMRPPSVRRVSRMDAIAPSPAPLTAPSPNRRRRAAPRTGSWLALMSAGSTGTLSSRHSARYSATLSDDCDSIVSSAAMKWRGIVRLQIRRLIREQRVGRRVRLRKAVAGEVLDELEDLRRLLLRDVVRLAALDEAGALGRHLRGVLLPHRAAQLVGLSEREAGQLAGQPHDLFLIGDDAVGVLEDRLHLRQVVPDLDPPVLAGDVVVDDAAAQRARPVERVQRDQVLEALRLRLAQHLAHARALELEHAVRLAGLEDLVASSHRPSASSARSMPTPSVSSMCFTASSSSVSVLRPRKSIFRRPTRSISFIAHCVVISPRPSGSCRAGRTRSAAWAR